MECRFCLLDLCEAAFSGLLYGWIGAGVVMMELVCGIVVGVLAEGTCVEACFRVGCTLYEERFIVCVGEEKAVMGYCSCCDDFFSDI